MLQRGLNPLAARLFLPQKLNASGTASNAVVNSGLFAAETQKLGILCLCG